MSRIAVVSMFLLLATVASAQEGKPDPDAARERVQGWIQRFEPPDRPSWQKPAAVLRVLGVDEGDRVADIGAGTGYFLPFLSAQVAASGKVYAVDIDPDMLAYLDTREFPYPNVQTVQAATNDPKLPPGELDAILLVDTWHHIDNRVDYIRRMGKALNPYGRVAIVDFHKKQLPVGPPVDHKLDRETVLREFDKAGWNLLTESTALPYQYFLVFGPPHEQRPLSDTPTSTKE